MPVLILSFVATTLLIAPANPGDSVNLRTERIDESTRKVKELQDKRIATLQDLVTLSTKLYLDGRAPFDQVCDAQQMLLKAQLEVAEKESDRLVLYKNYVEMLKQTEKVAQAQQAAGRGNGAAVLSIKARRLEAEIRLEQATAKAAKKKETKENK